jgi:hypothetical protein
MQIEFSTPETTIEDYYTVNVVAPASERIQETVEITAVKVRLMVMTKAEEDFEPGDISATIDMWGYHLTAKGERAKNKAHGQVYGHWDEETRWEVTRQALLASCERHHLDPTKVRDASIATWAEHQREAEARMLARFGIQK